MSLEVVPYIGTWIETISILILSFGGGVVPYIGTWIETDNAIKLSGLEVRRTLYRYVD